MHVISGPWWSWLLRGIAAERTGANLGAAGLALAIGSAAEGAFGGATGQTLLIRIAAE